MAKSVTTAELRKMTPSDLQKEISDKRAAVAKMRMAVMSTSEKDTAKFRREKKEIARMLTILGEINTVDKKSSVTTLKPKTKVSTVPASKKATSATSSK